MLHVTCTMLDTMEHIIYRPFEQCWTCFVGCFLPVNYHKWWAEECRVQCIATFLPYKHADDTAALYMQGTYHGGTLAGFSMSAEQPVSIMRENTTSMAIRDQRSFNVLLLLWHETC